MKTLTMIMSAAAFAVLTGCQTIPTTETISATATAVGVAAGTVANQTALDDKSREAVIDIVNIVDQAVPTNGQKFASAWMPIAQQKVTELLDVEKIDNGQAVLILEAFSIACQGIDYLFDVRYPGARSYEQLVSSAVHGFTYGFLLEFKPKKSALSASPSSMGDAKAYDYLIEVKTKRK